jgi:hypothetical protein
MAKKLRKLELSLTLRNGETRSVTHAFALAQEKLPASFSVEGLMITVAPEAKPKAKEKGKDKAGKDAKGPRAVKVPMAAAKRKQVEITLKPAKTADEPYWRKYGLIPVPSELRSFFPKFLEDFVVKTPRGEFVVRIGSAHDFETGAYRGRYLSGAVELMNAHRDLEPGDTVVFKRAADVVKEDKAYRCYSMSVKRAK